MYVRFSQKELLEFTSNAIRAAMHFVVPEMRSMMNEESNHFESFDQINKLFMSNRLKLIDEWMVKLLKELLSDDVLRQVKRVMEEKQVKFRLPQIAAAGNQ